MSERFDESHVSPRSEKITVWTGDEIQKWFDDIRIGDQIVSDSGTVRTVLILDGGPLIGFRTRKYNAALGQYMPEKFEQLSIETLRKHISAIRSVERGVSR